MHLGSIQPTSKASRYRPLTSVQTMLCPPRLLVYLWCSHWTLFLYMESVLGQQVSSGPKRHRPLKLDISSKWKDVLQTQRVKENILKSLNISRPPFVRPRTLQVPKTKIPKGDPADHFDTLERMRNVSIILSEATDPYRKDRLVFKIHSKIRSQISNIENPLVILRLRLNTKRLSASREKLSSEAKGRTERRCKNKTSTESTGADRSSAEKVLRTNKNCDDVKSKGKLSRKSEKRRRRQRKRKRSRKTKSRKIKMIVRVVDSASKRRRRIFVEKILLRRTKTITVPIPKKLFRAAAESPDHALIIQITCRNCKRFVKMDRVYRRGRKKSTSSNNALLLNPNRPYLYIRKSVVNSGQTTDASKARSKRQLNSKSCIHFEESREYFYQSSSDCCEHKTYYSFEELGLDDTIVSPHGFNYVHCIGYCGMTGGKGVFQSPKSNSIGSTGHGGRQDHQCTPTSNSHLDILYFDSKTIIPKRLMNFIGGSCGCAAG